MVTHQRPQSAPSITVQHEKGNVSTSKSSNKVHTAVDNGTNKLQPQEYNENCIGSRTSSIVNVYDRLESKRKSRNMYTERRMKEVVVSLTDELEQTHRQCFARIRNSSKKFERPATTHSLRRHSCETSQYLEPILSQWYTLRKEWNFDKKAFQVVAKPDHYQKVSTYYDVNLDFDEILKQNLKESSMKRQKDDDMRNRKLVQRSNNQKDKCLRPISAPVLNHYVSWQDMPAASKIICTSRRGHSSYGMKRKVYHEGWRRHHMYSLM